MQPDPYNTERNVEMSKIFLITCASKKIPLNKVEELTIRAVKKGFLIGSEGVNNIITQSQ